MACDNLIICQQGATIVDRAVIITPAENYQLPPEAHKQLSVIIFYILRHDPHFKLHQIQKKTGHFIRLRLLLLPN
jgi:hypothetical protein